MGNIKRYWNAEERISIIKISGLWGEIDSILEKWKSLGRSPEALKYLKTSNTFLEKALNIFANEVTDEEYAKVIKMCHTTTFDIKWVRPKNFTEKIEKPDYILREEEAMKAVEVFIDKNCKECEGKCCNKCWLHSVLTLWEIPPINEVTAYCPWAYKAPDAQSTEPIHVDSIDRKIIDKYKSKMDKLHKGE